MRAKAPELSVIIPTLEEATALPRLLDSLQHQHDADLEILVADGGSSDGTPEVARKARATVIDAPRGRGRQMNAAAAQARGEFLLFLHADSVPESPHVLRDALRALKAAIAAAGTPRIAGHFPVRFERGQPGHDLFFTFLEGKTALNRPFTINGDQGVLIGAAYFRELGGFDERLPFLEDQRLAAKVWRTGRWIVLPGRLATSARRFEAEGHRARLTLMALIMGLHESGFDEFFAQAPDVYPPQAETGRLDLRAWLRTVRASFRRAGLRRTAATFWRAGRFVRQNAWQVFYRHDLLRGARHHPALAAYDRWRWLLDHPATDALAAALLVAWFYAWLPATSRPGAGPGAAT